MNSHVYRWTLRPEPGLTLDLRVTASSVVVARRAIRRFLVDHDGATWSIECVSRETASTPSIPLGAPEGHARLA